MSSLPGAVQEGRVLVQLTHGPLDITALTAAAAHPRCGAVSSFIGTTRDHHGDRAVERLEYEAYEKMAVAKMRAIGDHVAAEYDGVHFVAVAHRLGHVAVTEASVVIIVATEHRAAGLASVGWAIDELKRTVPIWKRELYVGETEAHESACCNEAQWKSNPEFHAAMAEE